MKNSSNSNRFDLADLQLAYQVIENNGIVLYPTDTIWGIGCLALNEKAIEKIRILRNIPNNEGLVILVPDFRWIDRYVKVIPEIAYQLVEVAIKPLTIVYPNAINLPDSLLANDKSIAIRVTTDNFCKKILETIKAPLVSTAANTFGNHYPLNFLTIEEKIVKGVDHVVNYRQHENRPQKPSEMIKVGLNGEIQIIRSA